MDYFSIRKQFICPTFDLEVEEAFKKPSAKRLSQKGKKINEKTMQEKKKK